MKKLLFLLLTILFASCAKHEVFSDRSEVADVPSLKDLIFKSTGCIPTDAESVKRFELLTDNQGVKYLFGSRYKDENECFWFAQYDDNGKQNWEIIIKGELPTFASIPKIINNGSLVVGNVSYTSLFSLNTTPILIDPHNGKYKQIKVIENYYYTDVFAFDDFFFCSVSKIELERNKNAIEWYAQIGNDGEVIYHSDCMNIPSGKALFINESIFIDMTSTGIAKKNVKCEKSLIWEYPVDLPENKKCEMELSLKDDDINAIYRVTLTNGEQKTIRYKLSLTTGKEPVRVTEIKLPDTQDITLGEELYLKAQIKPENASITDLIWQSSDNNIVTVDSDGKIKAINKGECIVTVTTVDGNYQAECKIRVKMPTEVSGILINPEKAEMLLGTTSQLTATVLPATAINRRIQWSSSNESIVSVDQNGNITANAVGSANITVKTEEGNYTATSIITVVDITKFIYLNIKAAVIITDGYVSGSIFCSIENDSKETITITKMEITDGNGNLFSDASKYLPKTLAAGESYTLGSDKFNKVYYPIFLWYIEYEGKTYCIKYQYKP